MKKMSTRHVGGERNGDLQEDDQAARSARGQGLRPDDGPRLEAGLSAARHRHWRQSVDLLRRQDVAHRQHRRPDDLQPDAHPDLAGSRPAAVRGSEKGTTQGRDVVAHPAEGPGGGESRPEVAAAILARARCARRAALHRPRRHADGHARQLGRNDVLVRLRADDEGDHAARRYAKRSSRRSARRSTTRFHGFNEIEANKFKWAGKVVRVSLSPKLLQIAKRSARGVYRAMLKDTAKPQPSYGLVEFPNGGLVELGFLKKTVSGAHNWSKLEEMGALGRDRRRTSFALRAGGADRPKAGGALASPSAAKSFAARTARSAIRGRRCQFVKDFVDSGK